MKLITKELEQRFAEVGKQDNNPLVITKFFDPVGSATWYATEYEKETNVCYGYVTGMAYDEWGTFSVTEFEEIKRSLKLQMDNQILTGAASIERDIHFKETRFDDLFKNKRLEEIKEIQSQKKQGINQDKER